MTDDRKTGKRRHAARQRRSSVNGSRSSKRGRPLPRAAQLCASPLRFRPSAATLPRPAGREPSEIHSSQFRTTGPLGERPSSAENSTGDFMEDRCYAREYVLAHQDGHPRLRFAPAAGPRPAASQFPFSSGLAPLGPVPIPGICMAVGARGGRRPVLGGITPSHLFYPRG